MEGHRLSSDERLLAAVERISAARKSLVQDVATRRGLSPLQVEIVRLLASRSASQPQRSTDLAIEMGVSTATMSDAVQALRRKQLVIDRAGTDGRTKHLRLSRAGHRTAAAIAADLEPYRTAADSGASVDDGVVALLGVIRTLWERGVVTVDRSCATCSHHRPDDGLFGRCALLDERLTPSTLRVDCPEHSAA